MRSLESENNNCYRGNVINLDKDKDQETTSLIIGVESNNEKTTNFGGN